MNRIKMEFYVSFTMLCKPEDVDLLTDELHKLLSAAICDSANIDALINRLERLYSDPIRRGEYYLVNDAGITRFQFRYIEEYQLLWGKVTEAIYNRIVEHFKSRIKDTYLFAGSLNPSRYADSCLTVTGAEILNDLNHFHLLAGIIPVVPTSEV